MDLKEKKYWIGFSAFFGIGPIRFKLLLKHFGSANKAYHASELELKRLGLPEKVRSEFIKFRNKFDIDSYILRLNNLGIEAISLEEEYYPIRLKEIEDPSIILYLKTKKLKIFPFCLKNLYLLSEQEKFRLTEKK